MDPSDSIMRQSSLGRTIRRERGLLQLSQRELAERCRVHVTSLNKIENGGMNLSLETLTRIAVALKLKPSELLAKSHL